MLKVMHIVSGDLWAGAEVQAYTLISALSSHCDLKVVLMNPGRLERELKKVGISTEVIDESQHSSLGIVFQLKRLMKAYNPDVIHTHRQKENVLGSLANRLTSKAASVRTVHGASEFQLRGIKQLKHRIDDWVGRYWQQGAIAVSDVLLADLNKRYGPGKTVVIPNGIDAQRLKDNAQTIALIENHSSYQHIGLIGRLEPVKRVDIFLNIAKAMLEDQPGAKPLMFHVIGDGSLKTPLEKKSQEMNLDERVVFHGHRDDIASCIQSLDALVLCSDHEGSPMTALEALALGKPMVAHRVGGLVEMLADYPECLVAEQSPEAFRQALYTVLRNQSRVIISLAERFEAHYNAMSTLEVYQSLASRSDA